MPSYLVETYLARGEATQIADRDERARRAAAELTRGTTSVRLRFAIHVPEDETCFYVFEAPSAHQAALAAQRAGLDPIRVVEAVSSGREEQ
jgi:hypothetical protein